MRTFIAILSGCAMLVTSIVPSFAQGYGYGYGYDQYGRSTDPNCYRGPNQVYVCGDPRSSADYQGGYRRRGGYGYDQYGRSTDPNCYRGPNQVYVCGGGGNRRRGSYDQYGRSTDPNCYRGPNRVYVC